MFEPQNMLTLNGGANLLHQYAKLKTPFTFKADGNIGFRLYPDNRPRNLEIAALQKGIVLLSGGSELVEEGAGFGVPISMYVDTTLFSSTAEVYLERVSDDSAVVTKIFLLDAVSKKQIYGALIDDGFYSVFHKAFEKVYHKKGGLRPVFDLVMVLRKTLGVKTRFVKVPSRGKVVVTYHCFRDQVRIHTDISGVDKVGCREILLLNEQGATTFKKHWGCDGRILVGRQIGAWAKICSENASFSNAGATLSFSLENRPGASLYSGWEQVKNRFSWAGMTYSLDPCMNEFDYTIRIIQS